MNNREKFAKGEFDKEKKPIEEEDHAEEVSFGSNFMYLKMTLFTFTCCFASYKVHCHFTDKLQARQDRFDGITPEYDPSDSETQAKLTD